MGVDLAISGAERLRAVGKALKDAGGGDLRRELLARIRAANKDAIDKTRENARATLPSRGGLAARVAASQMASRTRLSGNSVGVRVEAKNAYGIAEIDQGILRHPLFGNRGTWFRQLVTPKWFTGPMEDSAPATRDAIEQAMSDVVARLDRA